MKYILRYDTIFCSLSVLREHIIMAGIDRLQLHMDKRQCLTGSETAKSPAGGKDDEGERLSKYSADAFPRQIRAS